jgi:hypothetical protein
MNSLRILKSLIAGLCFASLAAAQADSGTTADPEIDAINKKYQAEYQKIQNDSDELAKDAPKTPGIIDLDFSKMQKVSFEVPEFRMKHQRIVIGVPEVSMRNQSFSWDQPTPRMKTVKVGQRPVIHGTKISFEDIIISVPEVVMVRKQVSLDVPVVKITQRDMSLDLPEVFRTKTISFDVPSIKVRTTEQAQNETEEGAKKLEARAGSLADAQKKEIIDVSKKRALDHRADLLIQAANASSSISAAIVSIKKIGGDPANVTNPDGSKTNLFALLESTSKKFADAISQLDAQIAALGST